MKIMNNNTKRIDVDDSNDESSSPSSQKDPASSSIIDSELTKINQCMKIIDASWSFEVKLYEHNVQQGNSRVTSTSTSSQPSFDSRIFPYHQECYRLLDMYLGLDRPFEYEIIEDDFNYFDNRDYDKNDDENYNSPSMKVARRRLEINENRHYEEDMDYHHMMVVAVDGYLPCSYTSILQSLVPSHRLERYKMCIDDYGFEGVFLHWETFLLIERNEQIHDYYEYESYEEAILTTQETKSFRDDDDTKEEEEQQQQQRKQHRIENISNKGLRTKVLLKLLKHSMSEIQRDHGLAQGVILSMIDNECFIGDDDAGVEAMRYFLTTFLSEYIYNCDGECHERYIFNRNEIDRDMNDIHNDDDDDSKNPKPTHYCNDYTHLLSKIKLTISDGIKYLTPGHSNMIVGFVVHLFNVAGWNEVDEMTDLMGYDDDDSILHNDKPHNFIFMLINGVGVKAYEDRFRLKTLLKWKFQSPPSSSSLSTLKALEEEIQAVKESHLIAVNTLVEIGKVALMRLPADTVTERIGSRIVRFLVLSSIDLIPHERFHRSDCIPKHDVFIGDLFGEGINESITNYNRYVDCMHAFKMKKRRLHDITRTFLDFVDVAEIESDELISEVFLSPPSMELQNVVRALFLSQLVDVDYSGCGYGDFLVWCRLPIDIYEPMLYEHIVNYPSNYRDEGSDDDSDDSDEEDSKLKYYDDEGMRLQGGYLKARYDFSLLLLKQAWAEPWSFKNHSSYQPAFRDAVWTMLLCAHRYGMSSDIPNTICSYLSRSFWKDDRIRCWRYECEVENMDYLIYNRGQPKSQPPLVCINCMTAHACNEKHLSQLLHEGHRRVCKLPPMRVFTKDDAVFCRNIAVRKNGKIGDEEVVSDDFSGDDDEDDDDSCWESIGSGEENKTISETELIFRYFETNAYKYKCMEEPAFAAFYSDA